MKKEQIQGNMPYTIVGSTATPEPRQSIILTAKGIQELAKRMDGDDMVRIEQWADVTKKCEQKKFYSEITIIRE